MSLSTSIDSGTALKTAALCYSYPTYVKPAGAHPFAADLFHRRVVWREAVVDVNLTVEHGELVGLLGPNGAGKTTLLKLFSGLLHPSTGDASVHGFQPERRSPAFLRSIGVVFGQKSQLNWDLPALDTFTLLKAIYRVPKDAFAERLTYLSSMLSLTHQLQTPVRKLSLGERMKCELVAALLHQPSLLLLDEPTIGLDIASQRAIRNFLLELNRHAGTTVIMSSHYPRDIEAIARRAVAIMNGRIHYDGPIDDLPGYKTGIKTVRVTLDMAGPRAVPVPAGARVLDEGILEYVVGGSELAGVLALLADRPDVVDIQVNEPQLEDALFEMFHLDEGRHEGEP